MCSPIGFVESPYKERFGTPRQAVVTAQVAGGDTSDGALILTLENTRQMLQDLDGFSHLWVIARLHLNTGWKPLIKPPRGPKGVKRGLYATRAPHRPNQLSLSCVQIISVDPPAGRISVRGLDLIDGTPILDIKPYIACARPGCRPPAAALWGTPPPHPCCPPPTSACVLASPYFAHPHVGRHRAFSHRLRFLPGRTERLARRAAAGERGAH